ncbi:MAG: hypothetical protein AABZ06_07775 [Bdellovibrionota bacterium]
MRVGRVVVVLISFILFISGCGPNNSGQVAMPTTSIAAAPSSAATPPPQGVPGANVSDINGNLWQALLGVYSGTLHKNIVGTIVSQPFKFTLTQTQGSDQAKSAIFISFESSGPIGQVNFQSYLNVGLNALPVNGVLVFGFMSSEQNIQALTDVPFALELILSVQNGKDFDPKQSAIFIKDCSFASTCSNPVPVSVAWFDEVLAKH